MLVVKVVKSERPNKRFKAIFIKNGDIVKQVHFGSASGKTFIDHGDESIKKAYIARHKVNEDWTDLFSAGALSRYILWGKSSDMQKNIRRYNHMLAIR